MKGKDFLSRFPNQKGILQNSYEILEEVSNMLGLADGELLLLFKLLRRTEWGQLVFRCGHLEIDLDRKPEDTEQPDMVLTFTFEKDQAERLFHYHYSLSHLEAMLRHKHKCNIQGE